MISAVRDMKGSDDGKGDIVVLDPDAMVWRRFYSPTFSEQSSITFGDLGAVAQ